jgi:hypothetical protein
MCQGLGRKLLPPEKVSSRLRKTPTSGNYLKKPYAEPPLLEAIWSGSVETRQNKMRFLRVKRQ